MLHSIPRWQAVFELVVRREEGSAVTDFSRESKTLEISLEALETKESFHSGELYRRILN